MKRHWRILLGIGLLALVACGDSDEDDIRSVAELVAQNKKAGCDHMTTRFANEFFDGGAAECRMLAGDKGAEADIDDVSVDGATATVTAMSDGSQIELSLVKRDDVWKVDEIREPDRSAEETAPRPVEEATVEDRQGRTARSTVEAYYEAIDDADGHDLCGSISKRYAARLLNVRAGRASVADCVDATTNFNWSKARARAGKRPEVLRIAESGGKATVTVSTGQRVSVVREGGIWLVDTVRGAAKP